MTFRDIIERIKRYPVPVVCGLIALVCLVNFNFRMEMLSELQIQRDEASRQAGQMDENIVASSTLEEHVNEMKKLLAELEQRIVRTSELEVNYSYFYRLESETGVALADLGQAATPPPARGAQKTAFVPVGYNLILSGSFPRIIAYLNELENGSRFYRLKSFNLQRGREANQTTVTLAVSLEQLGWP